MTTSYFEIEYFNPLRNPGRYAPLSQAFGCELAGCYRFIVDDGMPGHLDAIFAQTWALDGYGFTKEVFSPCKLPWFARHFDCAVLTSEPALLFPPRRLRILSFYEHAHAALREAGVLPADTGDGGLEELAREAHRHLRARLLADAARLGVPTLDYREALTAPADALGGRLESLGWGNLDCGPAAAEIVASRRWPEGRGAQGEAAA